MTLDFNEFIKVRNFIYTKTGLFFEDKKIYFVKKRIEKRVEALDIEDPVEYIKLLRFSDVNGKEFGNLINLLTTNETYFFREFEQLSVFAEYCLPEIIEYKKANKKKSLRILSAGCSTGEEVYTLSIILKEMLDNYNYWDIEITGIDIDSNVLDIAKKGVYTDRSVKDVPPEYYDRYFELVNGEHKVKYGARKSVIFKQVNFLKENALINLGVFDFILCRNVLIYFNDESRKKVVNDFYEMLNPGGYIFLGHSESISRISSAFNITRKGGLIVYQKPE